MYLKCISKKLYVYHSVRFLIDGKYKIESRYQMTYEAWLKTNHKPLNPNVYKIGKPCLHELMRLEEKYGWLK